MATFLLLTCLAGRLHLIHYNIVVLLIIASALRICIINEEAVTRLLLKQRLAVLFGSLNHPVGVIVLLSDRAVLHFYFIIWKEWNFQMR